jgi:hypothetical protein
MILSVPGILHISLIVFSCGVGVIRSHGFCPKDRILEMQQINARIKVWFFILLLLKIGITSLRKKEPKTKNPACHPSAGEPAGREEPRTKNEKALSGINHQTL